MKIKFLLFLTLALILMLNACSPFVITSSSGEQPTPRVDTLPATSLPVTGYQPVQVDHVQVDIGIGSPIPVQVIVMGNLPDTCAQIELVQQQQEGAHFEITISTIASTAEGCVQDTLPFRIEIPLNITNLPAGSYTVDVNGVGADFQLGTGNTTSSQPSADTVIRKDDVEVPVVNMEIGVGSPIPVHAIVGLNLPNSCAQVGEIRMHREDNTFNVRLIAEITERADCREDSIPFVLKMPLNIVNLPEGPYEVNVNGVTASFDPRATPAAESAQPIARGQVNAQGLNLRAGPSVNHVSLGQLNEGTELDIQGRSENLQWLLVRLPNGKEGWVYSGFVDTQALIADLPLKEAYGGPDSYPSNAPQDVRLPLNVQASIENNLATVSVSGFPGESRVIARLGEAGGTADLQVGEAVTTPSGNAVILFNMPSAWSDGSPLDSNELKLVVSSADSDVRVDVRIQYFHN